MESRLQKFVCLINCGNFTKAAERLHVSQPALTTAIQKLERELKCELIVRGEQPIRPTPAGLLAYQSALGLQDRLNELRSKLQLLANERPLVRLGMIDSIASALFVQQNTFSTLEASAQLSLAVNNSSYLLSALMRNELDCILIARPPTPLSASLSWRKVGIEPLVLVTHPDNRIAMMNSLRKGVLPAFLSYNQTSTTYQLIMQALGKHGVHPEIVFYSTSPEVMLQLVRSGRGVAVLPYLMVREEFAAGTLTHLRIKGMVTIGRDIIAVHRQGRELLPSVTMSLNSTAATLGHLQKAALH